MNKIKQICAEEILDSRGNPTIEACVMLLDGVCGSASVPSGASKGSYEAYELRDNDESRYLGKGVLCAVENVNTAINEALSSCTGNQSIVDAKLIALDKTKDKSNLGANAILSVSMAAAKACANDKHLPLYRYIGGINAVRMPVPMMNILNGGVHAPNDLDVQELMIIPQGFDSFTEALRVGSEIFHALGKLLKDDGKGSGVGDEGGFAPNTAGLENALDYIIRAIKAAGYDTERVKLAIDCAAGEWYENGEYVLPKCQARYTSAELCEYYSSLCNSYPIISIEDGISDKDIEGWQYLTAVLGEKITLVGDDLFVTDRKRLKMGIEKGIANAILIKPNQIGTLSETLEVMRLAKENGYKTIVSHRSGETEDTYIADIAVGMNAGYIKCGAPQRSERVAKYNRLLRIEAQLGISAVYGDNCY